MVRDIIGLFRLLFYLVKFNYIHLLFPFLYFLSCHYIFTIMANKEVYITRSPLSFYRATQC